MKVKNSFTIDSYKELLRQAVNRYRFISYNEEYGKEDVALWRHDVDISPHRALMLAKIESDLGVKSTFFVQLTSYFYSVFEAGIRDLFEEIYSLGHDIGLHFDPMYHNIKNEDDFISRLAFEKTTLEGVLGCTINTFSMHNQTVTPDLKVADESYVGMKNASSVTQYSNFVYCSDSNGIWRHRKLEDVLQDPDCNKVHILTHPCWWQDEYMIPRHRVLTSLEGRRNSCINYYDSLLEKHGRININNK